MKMQDVEGKTFVDSVHAFVANADWLGPEDTPAVVSLFKMAAVLDDHIEGPIMSSFGLTYRSLMKKAPVYEAEDELDRLLKR